MKDFFEVDVQYPGNLHNLHNDLQFLPKRMEVEKVKKLVANLQNDKIIKVNMLCT